MANLVRCFDMRCAELLRYILCYFKHTDLDDFKERSVFLSGEDGGFTNATTANGNYETEDGFPDVVDLSRLVTSINKHYFIFGPRGRHNWQT